MRLCLLALALFMAAVLHCGSGDEELDAGSGLDTAASGLDSADPEARAGETTLDSIEGDVVEDTNYYTMTLDVELGPGVTCSPDKQSSCLDGASCCRYEYYRQGDKLDYSFGSTHIAPAISLAVADTMALPTFTVITFNFGILIGTSDKPPATPKSGTYSFSGFEPEISVDIHSKTYSSKEDDADGEIVLENWSAEEGGLFSGFYGGTIIQVTDKPDKLRAHVTGAYSFVLPEPQGGQPR